MNMDSDTAERWVVIAALIVAGVYAYRRLTEPTAKPPKLRNVLGQGDPPPLGTFATAWGVTFLGVSVMASASPQLGGAFALLILTADLLANAPALTADIAKHGGQPPAPVKDTSTAPASSVSGAGRNMFTAPFSTFPTVPSPFFTSPLPGAAAAR